MEKVCITCKNARKFYSERGKNYVNCSLFTLTDIEEIGIGEQFSYNKCNFWKPNYLGGVLVVVILQDTELW